jgi:hypothetical protein
MMAANEGQPATGSWRPVRHITLSRAATFSLLFFVFTLAYLFAPYWRLPPAAWQRACAAALTALVGLGWACAAAGAPSGSASGRSLLWLVAALVLLAVLNGPALASDIPWRGDEDHHIKVTSLLASLLRYVPALAVVAAAPVVVLLLRDRYAPRRYAVTKRLLVVELLVAAAVVAGVWLARMSFPMSLLARYPVLVNWLAAGPPLALSPFFEVLPEASFRVVPLLSAVLLAWFCAARTGGRPAGRVLYLLALGGIPVIFYYSSILYLEMPAVFLMVVVCLDIDHVLTARDEALRRRPAWYALILLGFVKETTIAFLAVVVACRLAARWREIRSHPRRMRETLIEARTVFCILLPLAVYLFYRGVFGDVRRTFSPHWANLSETQTYAVFLRAMGEQFGPAAILFPAGLVLLVLQRRIRALVFVVLAFAACGGLHLLDDGRYLGYSRFLLLLGPLVVFGVHECVRWATRRSAIALIIGLLLVAGANLVLCPLNLDGARKSGWGQYRLDISEHYYPYREALRYVRQRYGDRPVLMTGMHYAYYHSYYVGTSSRIAQRLLPEDTGYGDVAAVLRWARQNGYRHVLYHVPDKPSRMPLRPAGYEQERVFTNSAHGLVLYRAVLAEP